MQYEIDKYSRLIIKLDDTDRYILDHDCQDHGAKLEYLDDALHEQLICNDQFDWISPAVCGDLTDAQMLGVLGNEIEYEGPAYSSPADTTGGIGSGWIRTGPGRAQYVIARWAYMRYQVEDWREELLRQGKIGFEGGYTDRKNDPAALRGLLCLQN
jgi:hypothetical protein